MQGRSTGFHRERPTLAALVVALAMAGYGSAETHAPAPRVPRFEERSAQVDSLLKSGRYPEAEREAQALVAAAQAAPGEDSTDLARALGQLAYGRFIDWRLPDAVAACRRAIGILERRRGLEDSLLLQPLTTLTLTLQNLASEDSADTVGRRALAVAVRHPGLDSLNLTAPLNAMGWLHVDLSDFAGAKSDFERIIAILAHASGDHDRPLGSAYHGLGVALRRAGDYAGAEAAYERALAIREKCLPPDHPDLAWTLNNYANVRFDLGDIEGAADLHRRALAIREKRFGAWHGDVAYSLMNLGNCYELLGRYAEALPLERRALAIREKNLGPEHRDVASALNNLALVLADLHRYPEAESLYRRCIAIRERVLGQEDPEVGRALVRLAALHEAQGDDRGAESLYVRTLGQRERAYGRGHPETEVTRVWLSQCLLRQRRTREAFELALQAESLAVDHFRRTARALDERDALGLFNTRTRGLDTAVLAALRGGSAAGGVTRVWDAVVRARALVLDEMAQRQRALSAAADPAGRAALDSLTAARARLAGLVLRGPSGSDDRDYPAQLERAREDERAAEEAAALASGRFRVQAMAASSGFREVRAALPPGTALVAYVRCDSVIPGAAGDSGLAGVYAGLVQPAGGGPARLVRLGEARQIDPLIERWLALASRPPAPGARARSERECRAAGARLRAAVWDPLARWTGAADRVLVVPDAALDAVNFAALPASGGRYLVEEGPTISLLSAERDAVAFVRPRTRGHGLLALGAPAFDRAPAGTVPSATRGSTDVARRRQDDCVDASLRFEPLPATRAEIAAIGRLWRAHAPGDSLGQATLCLDTEASKAAFERLASGRRVLHLATHAFQLASPCARVEAHGRSDRGQVIAAQIAQRNPLLRTGLALAGADRAAARDQGLLTAAELAGLDLEGVEWAVLSACETARGQIVGQEGTLGLQRAFQEAGVGTLITSVWAVDDAATRYWMEALYRARFDRGLDSAEAVRAAQRATLAAERARGDGGHPYCWGAFVTSGDWR